MAGEERLARRKRVQTKVCKNLLGKKGRGKKAKKAACGKEKGRVATKELREEGGKE